MMPLIIGIGALALLALSSDGTSTRRRLVREPEPERLSDWTQWRLLRRFEKRFVPLPGDQLIQVDEDFQPRQRRIRRYRPCLRPCPWELKCATTEDGVEQFSISFAGELAADPDLIPYLTVRPIEQQPIDVRHAFKHDAGGDLTRDSYFANRRRYFHREQGPVGWFIIRVRTRFGVEWLFEHPSMFAEVIRARPALPRPAPPPPPAPPPTPRPTAPEHDYAELLAALLDQGAQASAAAKKAEVASEKTDQVLASLDRLRTEILEANKPRRKSADGRSKVVTEQLKNLKRVNADVKRSKAVIATLDAFDDEARRSIQDAIGQVADNAIEGLGNALSGKSEGT